MRILFSTYPWAFEVPGGGEVQLLKYEEQLNNSGVEMVRHDPWQAGIGDVDVVHFFSCIAGSSHFCHYVKSLGLPLVISASLWITEETKHSYPIDEIRNQLSLADAIVTNGEIESENIARVLDVPRERLVTIRNGFDTRFGDPIEGRKFRDTYGLNGPFILCVGNLEPRKNQLALVQAARSLGMTLVLVGHIRDPNYAEICLDQGRGFVHHVGSINHESDILRSAYAACDVFCLASTLETPGLAALEAAACGARVVVTSEGSTREYFGDHAIYVDPSNTQNIANGIRLALSKSRDDELRQHVVEHFTWPKVTRELIALYKEIKI